MLWKIESEGNWGETLMPSPNDSEEVRKMDKLAGKYMVCNETLPGFRSKLHLSPPNGRQRSVQGVVKKEADLRPEPKADPRSILSCAGRRRGVAAKNAKLKHLIMDAGVATLQKVTANVKVSNGILTFRNPNAANGTKTMTGVKEVLCVYYRADPNWGPHMIDTPLLSLAATVANANYGDFLKPLSEALKNSHQVLQSIWKIYIANVRNDIEATKARNGRDRSVKKIHIPDVAILTTAPAKNGLELVRMGAVDELEAAEQALGRAYDRRGDSFLQDIFNKIKARSGPDRVNKNKASGKKGLPGVTKSLGS
ncbi:hypothetical protein HDV05_006204 [Chytridiales sp. JEL 0842]|nr:hypothetical protein HDV05_006204 [Chytridiales sp. JEL 0842]